MHINLHFQKKHVDYLIADKFSLCVDIFFIPLSSLVIHWLQQFKCSIYLTHVTYKQIGRESSER